MAVTTWDGHLRIDHLADTATVALTLLTVEPTGEAEVRPGLTAGFVTADPNGPPAFVAFALQDGRMPSDIAVLLGPRIAAAVAELVDAARPGAWMQLDLAEVNGLAEAWAPYRARVTIAVPVPVNVGVLGTWGKDLWTGFGLPDWRTAVLAMTRPAATGFRGTDDPGREDAGAEEPDPSRPQGTLRLPGEVAAAVGVEREVTWTMTQAADGTIQVRFSARPTGRTAPGVLQVSMDDGSQGWTGLGPGPADGLHATLTGPDGPWHIRFRSTDRGQP
jgi:hypothetical protein